MRKKYLFIVFIIFISACSTQKNTWKTRHFHELTTRYNVHFNGHESFKKGIKAKDNAYVEDFSTLLPVYPISKNSSIGKESFDYCIKKCEKAIKFHSIRVKPKRKLKRNHSKKEQDFYDQEEFNPFMNKVFLLMAQSQFQKGDFEACASTCAYIEKHFKQNVITCNKAAILRSRALLNSNFIFDAENILVKLNNQELPKELTSPFSAAYAKLLLKQGKEKQAIPYIEMAIENTHNSHNKTRWYYLLAQLYQKNGNRDLSFKAYKKVINSNPSYLMEINARIKQTEVEIGSNKTSEKALKKLNHLLKSKKNTNYQDLIEYAIGNIYKTRKDNNNAIKHYKNGIKQNISNNKNSLLLLNLALGDLYYDNFFFTKAAPYISNSASLINQENKRYKEIQYKKEILDKLYPPLRDIEIQDSLLLLSKMPKEEIDKIIKGFISLEKKKQSQATLLENQEMLGDLTPKQNKIPNKPIFDKSNKDWYFFNPELVKNGLISFHNTWGNIKLEDYWRIKNKPKVYEKTENEQKTFNENTKDELPKVVKDSTVSSYNTSEESLDPLNPNYYLKNIPFKEAQKQKAREEINKALLKSGLIFRGLMQNDSLAINQFNKIEENNRNAKQLPEAYYNLFLIYKQKNNQNEAYRVREKILSNFSDSKYAIKLQDSLYIKHLKEMYKNQDSIYEKSFDYFESNKTDKLFENINFVKHQYKESELMPYFIFLESIEFAKIGEPQNFHDSLVYIKKTYPKSPLIPTIKDMLTLWEEGRIPIPQGKYKSSFNINSFKEKRKKATDSVKAKVQFNDSTEQVLLICYDDSINKFNLQFDVALYNFTNYLIKDFELNFGEIDNTKYLQVSNFENKSDIDRYVSLINFKNIKPSEKYPKIKLIIISKENLELLGNPLRLKEYLELYNKNYGKR